MIQPQVVLLLSILMILFAMEVIYMTLEEFGPFMVEQRKKKNLTQTQLAEQLNVSTATISKWERCLCLPEVTKFNDIAKAFNLSLMEVMQCKENEIAAKR